MHGFVYYRQVLLMGCAVGC